MESRTRNCFVSYHHEADQEYLSLLNTNIKGASICDHSLKEDIGYLAEESIYRRIREKMRNCSITIVLVGTRTGHRKWIDWEIWASLRGYTHPEDKTKSFKPSGLLAIFLPGNKHSIPLRLQDNIVSGYASCVRWENLEHDMEAAIGQAYTNRMDYTYRIDNSRKRQRSNYMDIFGFRI